MGQKQELLYKTNGLKFIKQSSGRGKITKTRLTKKTRLGCISDRKYLLRFNPKQSKDNTNKTLKSSVTKLFIYKHKE